ncbi:uncharacterized protein TM35_000481240 [Trypanosoma theileri]|uniref:EF-hand domain-containing protein n=1 Tax=Trypanosoma theileri TaxID=67003 RepID=A0A1X0NI68_9TRYP|nr:uncharacterized protein TM35_000481240 [Trypanosoma theileri]ORC84163.1 hypothetical protein TM35_000481240 [Trypanosoma theileri]
MTSYSTDHMYTQGEATLTQEPPPPRYVLQVSTGKWHRKSASSKVFKKAEGENMQNSLDYFLRKAMYTSVSTTCDNNKTDSSPEDVIKEIDQFEVRHCGEPLHRHSFPSALTEVNPIVGLLCGIPLYEIHDALLQKKASELQRQQQQQNYCCHSEPLRLTLDELYDTCVQLVSTMVSYEYLQRMFSTLPTYSQDNSVLLSAFFSFLVERSFHPRLNHNVHAIFKAFDPEKTGVISVAVLSPPVFLAWAELNLFGTLRGDWEKMAAALEKANGVDLSIVDGNHLLTPEATRAVFCASDLLYKAIESVEMDVVQTKTSF